MTAAGRPDDAFAAAICDAHWAACGEARRWATTPERERATFRNMAAAVRAAWAAGRRSEAEIAEALCAGFWIGCEAEGVRPWPWASLSTIKREFFREVARRTLAAIAELRAGRRKAAA